jgi:MFS family permease
MLQIGYKALTYILSIKVSRSALSLDSKCAKKRVDEKGLPEETEAFLFLVGFVSAGISASFAGSFADRHGRRTACLAYCIIYSFSSMTLLSDNIYVLFFGRVLGGISGTLLWSVFESWLVAEFNKLMLEEADTALSAIFSLMTTANTCVAIFAGLIAEWLVRRAGTAKAPFMLSIACLLLAFVAITKYWVSLQINPRAQVSI